MRDKINHKIPCRSNSISTAPDDEHGEARAYAIENYSRGVPPCFIPNSSSNADARASIGMASASQYVIIEALSRVAAAS